MPVLKPREKLIQDKLKARRAVDPYASEESIIEELYEAEQNDERRRMLMGNNEFTELDYSN